MGDALRFSIAVVACGSCCADMVVVVACCSCWLKSVLAAPKSMLEPLEARLGVFDGMVRFVYTCMGQTFSLLLVVLYRGCWEVSASQGAGKGNRASRRYVTTRGVHMGYSCATMLHWNFTLTLI